MSDSDEDLGSLIFGWVGTAIALFFYITPVVPFLKLIKGEITWKESPGILLICSFLNCILWSDYGLLGDKFSVYFANGLGGTITLIFIVIFLIHLANRNIFYSLLYNIVLLAGVIEIYFLCYYKIDPEITGIAANVFNVLMYAAPGEKMYTVCKTGNYELIPIWSTIGAIACSTSWMLYGFYQGDILLVIPNALGDISALVQIFVYFYIKGKTKRNNNEDENRNES